MELEVIDNYCEFRGWCMWRRGARPVCVDLCLHGAPPPTLNQAQNLPLREKRILNISFYKQTVDEIGTDRCFWTAVHAGCGAEEDGG